MSYCFKYQIYLLFTSLCILSSYNSVNGQYYLNMLGYRADTIYPKLINATAQEKMHVYNELAFYHSISSADSALFYSEASLKLAERYNNPYEKATAYRNMGNAYGLKGNYRQAIFYLQQSLKIFQDIGDPKKIAELYLDLGKINYDIEDFPRSQVYANKLIDLINKEENKKNPVVSPFENAVITGIVAYPFRAGENYKKAIMCFKQYLELSKQIDLPAPLNNVYIKSLAETYGFAGEYDSALKYTYLARNYLSANINKPEQEQTGYESDIGTLLYFKGDPDGALPLLRKAFYENRKNGSFHYAANDAVYLGDILKEKQNYDSALYFYKEALSEAAKMYNQFRTNITDTIQQEVFTGYQYLFNINQAEVLQIYYRVVLEIYKRLYKLYKTTDDPGRALANHEILYAYNDSLNRIIMNLEEKKLETRFASEQMEQQLAILEKDNDLKQAQIKQKNLVLFTTVSISLLLLTLIFIFYRQQRLKALQDKLLTEQRLFRSQMNPHFIFNSLASVQNFIVKQDDEKASIYLSRFSELVRSILKNSTQEQITLEEELTTIENYLELQKVRFPQKFDYSIEVDEKIDTENIFIPPMLAQPFIENSIEHGIKHKDSKGNIWVRLKLNDSKILYEVEDDGIGRKKAQEVLRKNDKDHKSMATTITLDRIKVLNKKFKKKIFMDIIDLKNDSNEATGTKVVFEIPF